MRIFETITIEAPIERVWALTVDLDALPSITPTVTGVQRIDHGPVVVGSRVRLDQPGLPRLVWTVETLDAPARFGWATRVYGVRMVAMHDLVTVGPERTELTVSVGFEGRGARLLGRLSRRKVARSLLREAEGFARASTAARPSDTPHPSGGATTG